MTVCQRRILFIFLELSGIIHFGKLDKTRQLHCFLRVLEKIMTAPKSTPTYTCNEYREEMILAGLRKQLSRKDLSAQERQKIEKEVTRLEKEMGF